MPINEECPGQMGHLQIGKHVGTSIVNKKDNRNNLSSQQRRISELIRVGIMASPISFAQTKKINLYFIVRRL